VKIPATYKCDVCGRTRDNDSNHWWAVWFQDTGLAVYPFSKCEGIDEIDDADFHLCGRECLSKKEAELLDQLQK